MRTEGGVPVTAQVQSTATLSSEPVPVYRYSLRRWWAEDEGFVRFVMLNPSTADAWLDDPTIRRCIGFARAWGYGGIVVHNLFALRATDPRALATHPDPVGPSNDEHLDGTLCGVPIVLTVCAWGAHRLAVARGAEVRRLVDTPHHLGLTASGAPRHPLYLPGSTSPVVWS